MTQTEPTQTMTLQKCHAEKAYCTKRIALSDKRVNSFFVLRSYR